MMLRSVGEFRCGFFVVVERDCNDFHSFKLFMLGTPESLPVEVL